MIDKKIDGLDSHVSQMYEWLPWVADGHRGGSEDPAARRKWLFETRAGRPSAAVRRRWSSGTAQRRGTPVRYAEAFEICETRARTRR